MSENQALNPTPTVEVFYAAKALLGEGPFFEPETNQLLWVDIDANSINFLNVDTAQNRSIKLLDTVGAVIPIQGSTNLLAAVGRKLCIVDRETGAVIEELASVEEDKPDNRFNDAKCDVNGRLWAGTMAKSQTPLDGNLYTYAAGKLSLCVPGVTISNGLGWSLDNKTMYYIDSPPRHIYSFDYNLADGAIANQKILVDFGKRGDIGFPDGMCTDIKGRIWVATFSGGCVSCLDPKTGDLILCVEIPGAKEITSCCFGGPDHSWLFVTCASLSPTAGPNGGSVFVIKDLGTKGLPANRFKH
ncbi:regucalcin-like [Halichondria panicea]|uniref:regucalcin-like n=1 Tax=Halichondria panicea TaxID=6063 RepID=UPI00312B6657